MIRVNPLAEGGRDATQSGHGLGFGGCGHAIKVVNGQYVIGACKLGFRKFLRIFWEVTCA